MDEWASEPAAGPCARWPERSELTPELGLDEDFGEGDSGVDESYCCRDIAVDYVERNHARSVN